MIGVLAAASCSSEASDGNDAENDVSTSDEVDVADSQPDEIGGDSRGDNATPDTTADSVTGPTSDVPSDTDLEAEEAFAEAELLTLSDMPLGWTEDPVDGDDTPNDEVAAARRDFVGCVGTDGDKMFDFARTVAATGTFTSPDSATVVHTIAIDDDATVDQFMSSFSAEGVETCLADNIGPVLAAGMANPDPADPLPDDLTFGDATVERLDVAQAGDETFAYRITMPLTLDGVDVKLFVDLVATRVGNAVSGIEAQSGITPFDSNQLDSLIEAAANRLV